MTTLTAPPAARPDLSAGAPWLAPAALLAADLAVRWRLPGDSAARVQHALGCIEEFYRTRQSLAADGAVKAVTASPILAEEGRALLHLAIQENVQRTLEIGFAFGMSACHLLRPGGVLVLHDAFLAATRTVANILLTNFGYVNESAGDVPNFMILRKTGADHLDWTAFASQFVPFEVERD